MDLFLKPADVFEKTAFASTRMPEDPNAWPQEVLQQLFKEVPYISDFSPHVVMDRVDAEKGYAFGHVTVMNKTETQLDASAQAKGAAGIRQVRIPIIIKDGELFPLDLLITDDSKVLPLTESRLRAAIFRPQAFDVTSRTPGDQSMIGQLYPPYRQNYGFGGGGGVGMSVGTEKTGSVLEAIAPTINGSDVSAFKQTLSNPEIRLAYEKNAAAALKPVSLILNLTETAKLASALPQLLRPTITQLTRVEDGYLVKQANHNCWAPQTTYLERGKALQKFGSKLVFAADTAGSVTAAEGATTEEPETPDVMQQSGPISEPGFYSVESTEGQQLTGYVIPNLVDTDGRVLPIALFTDGTSAAIQGDILGTPMQPSLELPTADQPTGYGVFFNLNLEAGSLSGVTATIPMHLNGSFEPSAGEPGVYQGETYDGRPVEVSIQPNIETIINMDGRMLVPANWHWMPLDKCEAVDLTSAEADNTKQAAAKRHFASVEVLSGGETFSIRGPAVEKLASDERQFLDLDGAMFLLAGLGVSPAYGIKKLGQAMSGREPVQIKIGRKLKLASEQAQEAALASQELLARMPPLRHYLFKEAAFITDPEAIDTVLSLGFINPENVTTFIGYMPTIEKTQESLCNLLFAARVGLSDIPTPALETAVRSTEEVLEGLKTMAFEAPAEYQA